MATTTNFGWETPDDTDLVKDGALAIRTLGSAIDTSLVDLKGGTTGQVLSKTSNTDMDFTWVTSDDANAIQNAIVDAKGDLIAASAADTPARLAVGSNGESIVADSSQTTGLRWQGNYSAGKNAVINGAMDIWQRGTSFTLTAASNVYTADRFLIYAEGANMSAARSATTPGNTIAKYSLEITGATSGTNCYIGHRIESANVAQYKGTVTYSVYVYNDTGSAFTPNVRFDTPTAADNFASVNIGGTIALQSCANGAWTRVSTTVDLTGYTNIDNGLGIVLFGLPLSANTKKVRVTGAQLEIGSVATAFQRAGATLAGELAACQRYYFRATTGAAYGYIGNGGSATNTTTARTTISLPVAMRVRPTAVDYGGAITVSDGVNLTTPASITIETNGTTQAPQVVGNMSSGVLTQYRWYCFQDNNAGTAYLGLSAEL